MQQIKKDFDRIALLSESEREVGGLYDRFLLQFIPADCDRVLEVGCGTGIFTRLLATQANHVTAIDMSAEMIRVARHRSTECPNIEYTIGNFLELNLPRSHFDCAVMIATLHHLPTDLVLGKIKQTLKPGGALVLHDLLTSRGAVARSADVIRFPVSVGTRWVRTGRLREKRELRRAWAAHGKEERYLGKQEVLAMRDQYLPGGYVKYHFLWRYTLVWRKQDTL
ncbi:MAG TPA: class I SAM-dependent methyltransferase [Blastocatellia bacterium]|nr:class I SAM-dependent methyltransferase [Blastocatellia bacterium]